MTPTAADILEALADLAPSGGTRSWNVARGDQPFAWVPDPHETLHGGTVVRLAALDALHRDERLLRCGWGLVAGRAELDGKVRTVLVPLLSQPVRLERTLTGHRIVEAGDLELTPLIGDPAVAARLESAPGLAGRGWLADPETPAWLRLAAEAAGLPVTSVVQHKREVPKDGLVVVRAAAVYPVRDRYSAAMRDALLNWSGRAGLDDTALAAVYGLRPADVVAGDPAELLSPLPLNAAQWDVVHRAVRDRVVVVSGPPGNGKSHAVVAAAMSTVDSGGSVLVATQSPHAADVLGDLAARYPGPVPVLFGDSERRAALSAGIGTASGVDRSAVAARHAEAVAARDRVRLLESGIRAALDVEVKAATLGRWEPLIPALAAELPTVFEPDADLSAVRELADALPVRPAGWWRRFWHGRRVARLRRTTGVAGPVSPDRLLAAADAAAAGQAVARLAATGGTDLEASWAALASADEVLAAAVGALMRSRARAEHRWTGPGRRSAAGLVTALRSGRARRREILAGLAGADLVRAVPLWIGTVGDVEDLLPATPGLFDLVILDEASHIDQVRAAPVLARARRAMVVGDPRQLRFVSFVADVDVASTLRRYGLDDRVDVRRVSAFDLAAGAAPVIWLDEHYRSAPHLIEFSAKRFYHQRIGVATRHPSNDATDVIDVVRVAGATVTDGVNRAEVTEVLRVVQELVSSGAVGIGVVTPFRAQADALESGLLAAYPVDDIERYGLRVGTVHAFQGSEAETVVASLGVVDADGPGRHRFAADPALFNVMVTRARRKMIVVTSLGSDAPELIADYLEYSESGPAPVPAASGAGPVGWAGALAEELRRAGVVVRPDYPVGRWTVDLCVGEGAQAHGLICAVHPEGPDAHLARQRELRRAGWRLVDAFASRWSGDAARAALDLALSTSLHDGG